MLKRINASSFRSQFMGVTKFLVLAILSISLPQLSYSQTGSGLKQSNDAMWQRTLWREMDLSHPLNAKFNSSQSHLSELVLSAYFNGKIIAYKSDSLVSPKSRSEVDKILFQEESDGCGAVAFFKTDCDLVVIKERIFFDKVHSRMRIEPQALSIFIPHDHPLNQLGFDLHVATFKYQDLVNNSVIHSGANSKHFSVNEANALSMHQAIQLRRFHAPLVKINNIDDAYFSEIKDEAYGHLLAQNLEDAIKEFEYSLWVQEIPKGNYKAGGSVE